MGVDSNQRQYADPPGSYKGLLLDHTTRYEWAASLLRNCEGKILDVACGSGYGSRYLAEQTGATVLGLDIDEWTIINWAQTYYSHERVIFATDTILNAAKHGPFDAIVSFETWEHLVLKEAEQLADILYEALLPNGLLIFSSPHPESMPPETWPAHKIAIRADMYRQWLSKAGFAWTEYEEQGDNTTSWVIKPHPWTTAAVYCGVARKLVQ